MEFEDSLSYFFMASFGSFEVDIFKETFMPDKPVLCWTGIVFVFSFVFINLLILINVVIAMMADTYSIMSSQRLGIYCYSVIRTVPSYS